jgi:hypothetical protein
VANAAVAGMSLRAMTQMWTRWAARFQPDAVILYPTPAFYLGERTPTDPGPPPSRPRAAEPWWTLRIVGRAQDRIEYPPFIQRRRVARSLASLPPPTGDWNIGGVPSERLRHFEEDLDQLVQAIRHEGAALIVMTHATAFGGASDQAQDDALNAWRLAVPRASPDVLLQFEVLSAEAVRRVAARRGVALIDLAAHMNGRREWFAGDFLHFNDAGAAVVADVIARRLREDPAITAITSERSRGPRPGSDAAATGTSEPIRAVQ